MSDQANQQANELLRSAGQDVFEAILDAISKGLWTPFKILCKLGAARGAFNHAAKMRVAEAYARKKGITANAAFTELDQMGVFEDYD